jgi:hypothetical protein
MPRRLKANQRGHIENQDQHVEPDSACRRELRSACQTNDSQRVGELLRSGIVSAADATACLHDTTESLSLTRMLLEHGADPAAIASTKHMSQSFELVKLLVEFGHDIRVNGHCILQ